MKTINQLIDGYNTIYITGHVRPDGDCLGACLGLYHYINSNFSKDVTVFLEKYDSCYEVLPGESSIINKKKSNDCDLFICLDCGDKSRVGIYKDMEVNAKKTVCIDHHISNYGFADINIIDPHSSSTSEILYNMMDKTKINKDIAACIYAGIISDTGVFRYDCTSPDTLKIASELIKYDINFSNIIDEIFFVKSYEWHKLYSEVVMSSRLYYDGKVILGYLTDEIFNKHGAKKSDLDGISGMLRDTKGVELAIFLHETSDKKFKISFRSKSYADATIVASMFGGGGHKKAAGGKIEGMSLEEAIEAVVKAAGDII